MPWVGIYLLFFNWIPSPRYLEAATRLGWTCSRFHCCKMEELEGRKPFVTRHPIPRCYFSKGRQLVSTQLHGFSDASFHAYAGVVYLRAMYHDTSTSVALVAVKTKVAPLTTTTIPKLELCGATHLSKLLTTVREALTFLLGILLREQTSPSIVLGWINTSPSKLKIYVANRVSTITSEIPANCWRHVNTMDNPADVASRGISHSELINLSLWWLGPPTSIS